MSKYVKGESINLTCCGTKIEVVSARCDWETLGKSKVTECRGKIEDVGVKEMRYSGCGGVILKRKSIESTRTTREDSDS